MSDSFILYMWISFYCFLLAFVVILSAKLVQYFRRWGDTRAEGVNYEKYLLKIPVEGMSLGINGMKVSPSNQSNGKTILLVSPFTVSARRYLYLATAFALNGYTITLIESRQSNIQIHKNNISATEFSTSLLNTVSPNSVIASDVFFPIFLPKMLHSTEIDYVILRPTLIIRNFHPIISFCLNIPWISSFTYLLRQILHLELPTIKSKTLLVIPRIFISNPLICTIENNLTIQQIRSRFSFRDKEALIFTQILRFITESSA
jgi:hypothetical protein